MQGGTVVQGLEDLTGGIGYKFDLTKDQVIIYVYIYMYIYVYIYMCVCVCIYVYMYVCIYICVYIYICMCWRTSPEASATSLT